MIKVGFHVSIAGSVANAPKYAIENRYGTFQIFTTSARSWKTSKIPEESASEFKSLVKAHDYTPFAHNPYLCNLASPNKDTYEKSKRMLIDNLNNCKQLGVDHLVIHLGSHLGKGIDYGIESICAAISKALDATEKVNILLENSSGFNNSVGSKFSEIGRMMDTLKSNRIGICFDTCHAFAAGYDVRTKESLDKTVREFTSSIDKSKIRLIHLNDAKFQLGSGRDRHWHIGQGYIGKSGFINFFKNKLFGSGFFVMETPEDSKNTDATNMRAFKEIVKAATGRSIDQ